MNRTLKKIPLILVLLAAAFSSSCDIDYSSHMYEMEEHPVPGKIHVGFADSITQRFAESFLDTMDVEIVDESFGFRANIRVDSGAAWYYRDKILNMWNVVSVGIRYGGRDEKDILSVVFNDLVDTTYAYEIAGGFRYLTLLDVYVFQPRVTLKVEIGSEEMWIAKFEEYEFVEYAEQAMEYK